MYKLTFGADLGTDNGIFNGGSHASVEDAIKVAEDELSIAHCVYGAFIKNSFGNIVAESNSTWGDQNPNWHCNIDV